MEAKISSVLLLSHVRLSVTPWTAACQISLSSTNSQSLLKLMSVESVVPSNHLILCHPLLLLPLIFPSIKVFSNKSAFRIRWPKYWSFSISPSDEYSELIYFRINSSLRDAQESSPASQFKSINSLVLSLLYSPTLHNPNDYCKNHSFMWTFIGKVMSLLFNTWSRFVIAFLLRIKRLWISWLQSLSTVIESQECI